MQNNFVWGTHAEIFSMSLCIGKPVFVAVKSNKYYWAKYVCKRKDQMISLSCTYTPHLELPLGLDHMEIGHHNNNHYEVILNTDKSLPCIPPFTGDVSSSVNLCG